MDLLFWSVVVSFTNMFSITITPKILSVFLEYFRGDQDIMSEILLLENKKAEVSIVKEFSKYAKLQRRINKLVEQREDNIRDNVSSNFKIKLFCKLIINTFCFILNVVFVYYNYNQTVLEKIPYNWFSPLSWFISWPLSKEGAMSFIFWYSITNYIAKVTTSNIVCKKKSD